MNLDDPAYSPGCFKMFNTTGSHREGYPNRLNPGNSRAMPVHSGAGPELNPLSTLVIRGCTGA